MAEENDQEKGPYVVELPEDFVFDFEARAEEINDQGINIHYPDGTVKYIGNNG